MCVCVCVGGGGSQEVLNQQVFKAIAEGVCVEYK